MADSDLLLLLETLPYDLLLVDSGGAVRFANAAGRAHLELGDGPLARGAMLARAGDLGTALADAVAELTSRPAIRPSWVRYATRAAGKFRLLVQPLPGDLHALLVQRLQSDEGQAHQALVALGLDAAFARLAARACAGWSNLDIAQAFRIPLGTVKSRLNAVFRRLGVRRRAGLLRAVEAALEKTGPVEPPAVSPIRRRRAGALATALRQERTTTRSLRGLVHRVPFGLGVLDGSDEPLWTNPEGAAVFVDRAGETWSQLATEATLLAGGGGPVAVRLGRGRAALRAMLWPIRPGLTGVCLQRAAMATPELEELLHARYGLSRHQAHVAALIAGGRTNAEIARELGLHEGSVSAQASVIYGKLGLHSRHDLAAFATDLGADL
ncbi:MAG TPA: LuxR C-terminal-related transcriptional regulator [Polyangia bacterium]|jgi:DNA-binding NarL/FixJ family response regulator